VYYIATVDYSLMRRDAKKVAEWHIDRIIPCHGDVLEGSGDQAWATLYQWFLQGSPEPSLLKRVMSPVMKVARRVLLM